MQGDQVEQQETEHNHQQPRQPSEHNHHDLGPLAEVDLKTANSHLNDHNHCVAEGRNDTDEEGNIVPFANTVIEPHTVMVELVDAAVAGAAMLGVRPAVAVTELAEQYFIVFG